MRLKTWSPVAGALTGFLCMLPLSAWMQNKTGAYVSDFASYPDEPAHVVSGLLIRDYVAGHLTQNPLKFAESYYVHFPKVAIGHWPPLFHAVLASWMLAFGRSKANILMLLACLSSALVAALLYQVWRRAGIVVACASAAVLASTPFLQDSVSSVMPDLFLSLLAFSSMAAWGVYLENGRIRAAALAIALVAASLATNARGVAVLLALLLAGSFAARSTAARWRFTFCTALVLLLLFLPGIADRNFRPTFGIIAMNFVQFMKALARQLSWPAAALAAYGAFLVWRNRNSDPRSLTMLCLLAGTCIVHSLLNFPFEVRYLAGAIPASMVLFAAAWSSFSPSYGLLSTAAVVLTAGGIAGWNLAHLERKPDLGYHTLVNGPSDIARSNHISLIAGNSFHEGAYIAEMDLADAHLGHIVLRGSKVLASSSWAGYEYHLRLSSAAEISRYLDKFGVTLVIVQDSGQPHIRLLLDAVNGGGWQEMAGESVLQNARVFQRREPLPGRPAEITIEMGNFFGRDFQMHE